MAQSAHAVADYIFQHPSLASDWHQNSNYIVCLSIEDEASLLKLESKLSSSGISFVSFREPDIENQLTSIATSDPEAARYFSNLPLALKELGRQQTIKQTV